ncbi:MAG: TauD/TfdA family dioxygenase [Proteobacteria bacterium]|nr:TauD/TfdA family dioxygenase [Pseudomonadota bacterium]
MSDPSVRNVSSVPERLTVEWSDGGRSEYPSLWLRDNLAQDRDAHSGQRLVDIVDLPLQPRIRSAAHDNGGVRIDWEDEPAPATFSSRWLAAHAAGRGAPPPQLQVREWLMGAGLTARRDFAWGQPAVLAADPSQRLAWLTRLLQDGLAFLEGVPPREGAILEVMRLVGHVLETNYGLTFDVRSVPQPENLAYSDLGLGLHTDNPYRDPVPGFQALHALIASDEGGDSLFADGFALAQFLRQEFSADFELLTRTAVPFSYSSGNAELYAERPLIQLGAAGRVAAVHYNSRSIAPLHLAPAELPQFYRAYRRFATLMREAPYQLRTRLGNGTLVVFDNQRILHGRTAFSSARSARHLQGCYLTRDSVYSEAALLRRRNTGGVA